MKVKNTQLESFTPFSIEITFESEDEAARYYALFNHYAVPDIFCEGDESRDIRDAIGSKHEDENVYNKCADALSKYIRKNG